MNIRFYGIALFCSLISISCLKYNDEHVDLINPEDVTGWISGDIIISKEMLRLNDNPIGQLVAKAFYHAFDEQVEYLLPELAIQNAGSIRCEKVNGAKLKKGAIKRKVLKDVLQFDEKIYVVEVTYRELKNILEHSVALFPTDNPKGSYLQVYGVRFKADCSRQAEKLDSRGNRITEGNRVSDVYVLDRHSGTEKFIEEFSDDQTVRLATSEYLLQGNDGYIDLKNKMNKPNSKMANEKSFEVIASYFLETYPVDSPLSAEPEHNTILEKNCKSK